MPYDFFDPDVSCAVVAQKQIRSVILLHRFLNNDYRFEAFCRTDESPVTDLTKLLTVAYQAVDKTGTDCFITGSFATEDEYEMASRMIPCVRIPMVYRGIMSRPADYITSEEWGRLREKAGFSNDMIPEDGLAADDDVSKDDEQKIKLFVSQNGFKIR